MSPESIPRVNGKGARDRITIPCGKCPACLSNKRADWAFRLEQELKNSTSAVFVTLTYSEDKLPITDPTEDWEKHCHTHNFKYTLYKPHVQTFTRILRDVNNKADNKYYALGNNVSQDTTQGKFRYFITGEYGTKSLCPHYHALLFNLKKQVIDKIPIYWHRGYIQVGTVTPASIMYTCKYMIENTSHPEGTEKPFNIMSRRPGIGHNYLKLNQQWHIKTSKAYLVCESGVKKRLPRYYKEKCFSKDQILKQTSIGISKQDKEELKDIQQLRKLGVENPYLYLQERNQQFKNIVEKRKKQNPIL